MTLRESQAEADVSSQVTVEVADEEHNEDTVELTALERKESLSLKCENAELKVEIVGLQCEISTLKSDSTALKAENITLKKELDELKKTTTAIFTEGFLKEKENKTILQFYNFTQVHYNNLQFNDCVSFVSVHIGFPEWITFSAFMDLLTPSLAGHHYKLPVLTLILMFLMKLRLNLFDEDIAHRFGVHRTTVSRNFHRVLDIAAAKTSFLLKWPERDMLRSTMAMSFRNFFKKCCIIIDCTEIFMEQPSDLLACAQV